LISFLVPEQAFLRDTQQGGPTEFQYKGTHDRGTLRLVIVGAPPPFAH
jgi:hypothetical protein